MIESILLDTLLIVVLLLITAVGAYRGGMREAFSAAGVLLGILLAQEWSRQWGDWIGRNTSLSEGGGQFAVSMALLLVSGTGVGYGVSAAFNYHPGPGGRIFGIVIAAGTGLVTISYILTWLRTLLFDGTEPEVVSGTYLARFLDGDAGLILLGTSAAIVGAALFGSIVKEQDDGPVAEGHLTLRPSGFRGSEVASPAPDKVERVPDRRHRSAPVHVQPPQQWDDRAGEMPPRGGRLWSKTWPSDAPGVPADKPVSRNSDVRQARDRRGRSKPADESTKNQG